MNAEKCPNCPHPIGQCKIMPSKDIVANSFNVVLDKYDSSICHVLQCAHAGIDNLNITGDENFDLAMELMNESLCAG